MPRRRYGEIPLPNGWEIGHAEDGKVYFIDHNTEKTTWVDPRDSYTKAHTFADCVGEELPYGWEQCFHSDLGLFYVDHSNKRNQLEDPREQWRSVQEQMLSEYLTAASSDLQHRHQVLGVKQHRLTLALEHYHALDHDLATASAGGGVGSSRDSVCSGGSSSSSCDPALLKVEVAEARERLGRLKHELHQERQQLTSRQQGLETLTQLRDTMTTIEGGSYSIEEAQAILTEVRNIENLLRAGQKEKQQLHQSLKLLGEDLKSLVEEEEEGGSSGAVGGGAAALQRHSIASQTDFAGENIPLGARLAELTRLRLEYNSAKSQLKGYQQQLASLDQRLAAHTSTSLSSRRSLALNTSSSQQHLDASLSAASSNRSVHNMIPPAGSTNSLNTNMSSNAALAALGNRLTGYPDNFLNITQYKNIQQQHQYAAPVAGGNRNLTGSNSRTTSITTLSLTSSTNTVSSDASSVANLSSIGIPVSGAGREAAEHGRQQLLKEKEQLLNEYRIYLGHSRDHVQILDLENKIRTLEEECLQLLNSSEVNVCPSGEFNIGFGTALEVEREELVRKLRDTVAVMVRLEGQLRSLSASTLSMSSSSSLGSLSTSSRGSASSLSFTDIYGGGAAYQGYQYSSSEHIAQSVADLQRRVTKHLTANTEQDRQYAEKLRQLQECGNYMSQSTLSLSPRSSLSSLSPPTSSCEPLPVIDPNSCDIDDYSTTLTSADNGGGLATDLDHIENELNKMRLFSQACSAAVSEEQLHRPMVEAGTGEDLECDQELRAVNQKLKDAGLLVDCGSVSGSSKDLLYHISNESVDTAHQQLKTNQLQHLQSKQNLPQYLQAQAMISSSGDKALLDVNGEELHNDRGFPLHSTAKKSVGNIGPPQYSSQHNITSQQQQKAFAPLQHSDSAGYSSSGGPSASDSNHSDVVAASNRLRLELALKPSSASEATVEMEGVPGSSMSGAGSDSGGRSSMSAAVSDESVAGDSGVYEAYPKASPDCPNTPQIQIKLRYRSAEGVLQVCVEKGRHLSSLTIPPGSLICVKIHLITGCPSIHTAAHGEKSLEPVQGSGEVEGTSSSASLTWCTHPEAELDRPCFGESFTFPVRSWSRLRSNTLQLNVWATSQDEEMHVAYAQVSMADFSSTNCEVLWINLLHFSLLGAPSLRQQQQDPATLEHHTTRSRLSHTSSIPETEVTTSSHHSLGSVGAMSASLLHSAAAHLRSASASTVRSNTSNTKEESSDESTVISSQTSTLTRNMGPECVRLNLHGGGSRYHGDDLTCVIDSDDEGEEHGEDDDGDTDSDEDEECQEDIMEKALENAEGTAVEDNDLDHTLVETAEKSTNTECVTGPVAGARLKTSGDHSAISTSGSSGSGKRPSSSNVLSGVAGGCSAISSIMGPALIKRSQTFTPSAAASQTNYICRLNRSDSDSCVGLHRSPGCSSLTAAGFQRGSAHRRSLRYKTGGALTVQSGHSHHGGLVGRTSLDLALDLAAQKQRLSLLQQELDALRCLKQQLHLAATDKQHEPPAWLSSPHTKRTLTKLAAGMHLSSSPEERRVNKVVKRAKREVHKLRHSNAPAAQPDVLSFKEKMAFFLTSGSTSSFAAPVVTDVCELPSLGTDATDDQHLASQGGSAGATLTSSLSAGVSHSFNRSLLSEWDQSKASDQSSLETDSGTLTKSKSSYTDSSDGTMTTVLENRQDSDSSANTTRGEGSTDETAVLCSREDTLKRSSNNNISTINIRHCSEGLARCGGSDVVAASTPVRTAAKMITRVSVNAPCSSSSSSPPCAGGGFLSSTPNRWTELPSSLILDTSAINTTSLPTSSSSSSSSSCHAVVVSSSSSPCTRSKSSSPLPPSTPVRSESLLLSSSSTSSATVIKVGGCGDWQDEEDLPVVPKRTTSLLPSEKVLPRGTSSSKGRSNSSSTSDSCSGNRPNSSVVTGGGSSSSSISSSSTSNLTSAYSQSTPSVYNISNNSLSNTTSTTIIPVSIGDDCSDSTVSIDDDGGGDITVRELPITVSDGSSTTNNGNKIVLVGAAFSSCRNSYNNNCSGGGGSSSQTHASLVTAREASVNVAATDPTDLNVSEDSVNCNDSLAAADDDSCTTADGKQPLMVRQLAARQSAGKGVLVAKALRPDVLFDSDDQGVEV